MSKRSAKKGATDGAATKKACMGTAGDSQQTEEEDTTPNVFSHDLDTLQCDICFMPFESQIYSCKNGHVACGGCCVRLDRKCPTCNESIGGIRCRAMEKILAGMTRPCNFKKLGCKHVLRFIETRAHEEETCLYAPYRCPFDGGCAYIGRHLRGHMLAETADHGPLFYMDSFGRVTVSLDKSRAFRVILQDRLVGESVFLLLNGGDVPTGRSLSVVRICPPPAPADEDGGAEVAQQYTIAVKGGHPASLLLTASGSVTFVRRLEGYEPIEFLFVPDACWGSSQTLTATVTVKL